MIRMDGSTRQMWVKVNTQNMQGQKRTSIDMTVHNGVWYKDYLKLNSLWLKPNLSGALFVIFLSKFYKIV